MEEKLTCLEGYQAVYGFLDGLWQATDPEEQELFGELERFLSGMLLTDSGTSAQPELMDLWYLAVRQAGGGELSGENAYDAMLRFLNLWAAPNSDGTILGICRNLEDTGPDREDWQEAVDRVRQGGFDPYFGLS